MDSAYLVRVLARNARTTQRNVQLVLLVSNYEELHAAILPARHAPEALTINVLTALPCTT